MDHFGGASPSAGSGGSHANASNNAANHATLILLPLNDSFIDARRLNLIDQGILLGRLIEGQPATPNTFDSKVVSRKHAHLFCEKSHSVLPFFEHSLTDAHSLFSW